MPAPSSRAPSGVVIPTRQLPPASAGTALVVRYLISRFSMLNPVFIIDAIIIFIIVQHVLCYLVHVDFLMIHVIYCGFTHYVFYAKYFVRNDEIKLWNQTIGSISSGWRMYTAVCHADNISYHHMSSGWLSWSWYLIRMSYDNVIMSSGWHTLPFLSHASWWDSKFWFFFTIRGGPTVPLYHATFPIECTLWLGVPVAIGFPAATCDSHVACAVTEVTEKYYWAQSGAQCGWIGGERGGF